MFRKTQLGIHVTKTPTKFKRSNGTNSITYIDDYDHQPYIICIYIIIMNIFSLIKMLNIQRLVVLSYHDYNNNLGIKNHLKGEFVLPTAF